MKKNKFLVPFNEEDKNCCFGSRVQDYLQILCRDIPNIEPNEEIFRTVRKQGLIKCVMGKNYISQIGKDVASYLSLDDPNQYTGHCFRRSSATEAANAGANTMELKRHFGWVQEGTALKYVDETSDRAKKMAKFLTESNANKTEERQCQASSVSQSQNQNQNVYNITIQNSGTLNLFKN